MAASSQRLAAESKHMFREMTSHSNPSMSLTAVDEVEIKTEYSTKNRRQNNPFFLEEETDTLTQNASEISYFPIQPLKLSDTNPFKNDVLRDCGTDVRCRDPCSHVHTDEVCRQPAVPLAATVAMPSTNPFGSAHPGRFIHSTPVSCHPPNLSGSQWHTPGCNALKDIDPGDTLQQNDNPGIQIEPPLPKCEQRKSRVCRPHPTRQPSSESEDDYDYRERVPTLRPGQYDGTTPWKEFLHRFESCAKANNWTEKNPIKVLPGWCSRGNRPQESTVTSVGLQPPGGGSRNCLWPLFRACCCRGY